MVCRPKNNDPASSVFYRALTKKRNRMVLDFGFSVLRNTSVKLRILSGGLTLELSALYGVQ